MNNNRQTQFTDYQKLFEEIALFEREAKEREQLLHFERQMQVGQGSRASSSLHRAWSQEPQPEPNFFISQSNITGDPIGASSDSKEARLFYRETAVLVGQQGPSASMHVDDADQPRVKELKDDERAQESVQ